MCLLSQQLEKADQERFELQKQLKALESGSALAAQKVCFAFSCMMNLFTLSIHECSHKMRSKSCLCEKYSVIVNANSRAGHSHSYIRSGGIRCPY